MAAGAARPHAVIIPYPAQGHLNPMLQLAKVLHTRGFFITYVNNEYNHRRLVRSRGAEAVAGLADFRFRAIPDGLPPSGPDDVTQDIPKLCVSMRDNAGEPFRQLLLMTNKPLSAAAAAGSSASVDDGVVPPPVTCVIADGFLTFAIDVAKEFGIPTLVFWTMSACGFMSYLHYFELIERGYTPLKDESYLTNGYLENTVIDWIPGMKQGIRLKDIPSFIRTTDRNDVMLNFDGGEAQNAHKAWGVIVNTFEELESDVLAGLRSFFPRLYTVGPLAHFVEQIEDASLASIASNLWKEDAGCLEWLDGQEEGSVVYVNFGSITVMSAEHLGEFAWGLARTGKPFLWVIRPDLVAGETAKLPASFVEETKGVGVMSSWCNQEKVLSHPSVGVFLTHSGWNSTLESLCAGVPMICWPFFAEQPTNCRYVCREWGVGVEIDGDVRREEVEVLVREMMEGEKGKVMRSRARDWKEKAAAAAAAGGAAGSSYRDMERLIGDLAAMPTV